MRKYLVAAMTATAAIGIGATAVAQVAPTATIASNVAPKNAGTANKPTNASLAVTITNTANDKIVTDINIQLPKTIRTSAKGFPTCGEQKMINSAGSACPKGAKVGTGTAKAIAGIGRTEQLDVTFDVTAFVAGERKINFLLRAQGLGNTYSARGTLKKNTKGTLLAVKVPPGAQEPVSELFATLTELKFKMGAKRGAKKLVATTGCKNKKHLIGVTLKYATPPTAPGGDPTPAGSSSATSAAACTK